MTEQSFNWSNTDVDSNCKVENLHHYLRSYVNAMSFELFDQLPSIGIEVSYQLADRKMSFTTSRSLQYANMDVMDEWDVTKLRRHRLMTDNPPKRLTIN